jgi:hypothetical protein
MRFGVRTIALTLISSLVLVACGGGGGDGVTAGAGGSTAPQAVSITESNATAVAASALDAAQNTAPGQLPIGVEVQAGGQGHSSFGTVARAVQFALANGPGALATGVTTSQACPSGGSISMTGDETAQTVTYSDCRLSSGADSITMNGSLSLTLISSSPDGMSGVVSVVANNFSMVSSDGFSASLNGDMRMEITISSTSETLVISGSALTTRFTDGGTTYTTTLRNYSQSISFSGFIVTSSLSATVESSSTALGAGGGSYTITTSTPVVQNWDTGLFTAGVVKVVGAGGSQLVMTVGSNNTVTIQIDANGDGTFEKTVSSTVSELESLL